MEVRTVIGFAIIQVIIVHLVAISQCASISSEDIQNWNNHIERTQNFTCSSPQPRSLRLDEIVIDSNLEDISPWEVFPMLTVLHRCDSQAGCCKSTRQTCRPKASEEVSLTFRIIPVNAIKNQHRERHRKNSFLHVNAVNHTACHCSSFYDHPKK